MMGIRKGKWRKMNLFGDVDINEDNIHFEEDELYNFDDESYGHEKAPPGQHHPHIRFPLNI